MSRFLRSSLATLAGFVVVAQVGPADAAPGQIASIGPFLERCPQNDPAYAQIRADFQLRRNGALVGSVGCSEPISAMPVAQYTDELLVLQGLRVMYYMDRGATGHLPWTPGTLYDWMRSRIGGIDISDGGWSYCCVEYEGVRHIVVRAQDEFNREFDKRWRGIAGNIDLYAHEARHADGFPHSSCCGIAGGCDDAFSEDAAMPPYAIQWFLNRAWLTGDINVGFSCLPPGDVAEAASWHLASVNSVFRDRFCAGPPAIVPMPAAPGGPCLAVQLAFGAPKSAVLEAATSHPVEVLLTTAASALPSAVTVDFTTRDLTAFGGADYTPASGTLTFPAGSTSGTRKTIAVSILDDALDEDDESFSILLSNPTGAAITSGEHTVSVSDDEPKAVRIEDAATVEGSVLSSTLELPVSLSNRSGRTVSVDFATIGGTALPGFDFAPTSGRLTFAPGTRTLAVPVTILADSDVEADEAFEVSLANPVAATLARAAATAIILDDDRSLRFYTVTPCRVLDTRSSPGPRGGPAIAAGGARTFTITDSCGVPAGARAVSLNVTATEAAVAGHLRLYPGGTAVPLSSTLNFAAGVNRANNAVVFLGTAGDLSVFSGQSSGSVHVVVDVNGYFQ